MLYVSPLKALSNDIHKNLDVPLSGIAALAAERGLLLPPIRTAVRTGDTPTSERQKMLKHPPHILVTTPESLFILLTSEKSRLALRNVRTVIVDEIHAMADDKRGAHLALSLARLDDLVQKAGGRRPQRIGLSATVRPIETVARFLAPDEGAEVTIINHGPSPRDGSRGGSAEGRAGAGGVERDVAGDLRPAHRAHQRAQDHDAGVRQHERLAERVAHHLGDRLGRGRRARASRQPLAQAPPDGRGAAEGRQAEGGGRDRVARARHRHRHRGSGLPDRLAALDCGGAAAHRPVGASRSSTRPSRRGASSPPRATS